MNFHVMTLFPEMVSEGLHTSILGRAMDAGIISLETVNIRDYSEDKHRHVDDYPYGGGAGMVMAPGPIARTYDAILEKRNKPDRPRVIYLTPWGKVFKQEDAKELAKEDDLVFLCGHYEGVDERVLEEIVTDYYSIGDYVFTFFGFIGLAVPSFILALVLMYVSYRYFGVSIGGLFSHKPA